MSHVLFSKFAEFALFAERDPQIFLLYFCELCEFCEHDLTLHVTSNPFCDETEDTYCYRLSYISQRTSICCLSTTFQQKISITCLGPSVLNEMLPVHISVQLN